MIPSRRHIKPIPYARRRYVRGMDRDSLEYFLKLESEYLLSPGMTSQQVLDAFVAVENAKRPAACWCRDNADTEQRKLYWERKAAGLNTRGGQNRLRKLLRMTMTPSKENVTP